MCKKMKDHKNRFFIASKGVGLCLTLKKRPKTFIAD